MEETIEYVYRDKVTNEPVARLYLYAHGHVLRLCHGYNHRTGKYDLLDELRFCKPEQGMACLEWQREFMMSRNNIGIEEADPMVLIDACKLFNKPTKE